MGVWHAPLPLPLSSSGEIAPGGPFRFHIFTFGTIGNLVLKIIGNESKATPKVILWSFCYTKGPRTAQMTG